MGIRALTDWFRRESMAMSLGRTPPVFKQYCTNHRGGLLTCSFKEAIVPSKMDSWGEVEKCPVDSRRFDVLQMHSRPSTQPLGGGKTEWDG